MNNKKSIALFALFLASNFCQNTFAQVKWPTITSQTKPWTRWWWLGSEVNNKDLTTVMEQYKKVGLGGLEITPIYGVQGEENQYIPFLTPQWMQVFDHTLKEGKRLDLGIDLANATGWPFGGPWIGDDDASKYMSYKMYTLKDDGSLDGKIEMIQQPLIRTANYKSRDIKEVLDPVSANKNLQELSLDQVRFEKPMKLQALMAYAETGEKIDIIKNVSTDGTLNWKAPAGKWTLHAVFMGWHGKQVERAAPGGEGNVIDHFSAASLQHYLSKFDQAFAGKDISSLRAFFNDSYEVDDARGQSNYTPMLFEEFKKRRGYDLKNELPALFTKSVTERSNRILCDYRMTIDELILEKFTQTWHQWGKSKGKMVRNQSHGSPANTLDLYGAVDIPETEGSEVLAIKFAPSAAHVLGKPLAASESATWLNEHFISSLSDVKKALDNYFIGGVNHIVYHGTTYSPPSEPWPGRLFYAAVEFDVVNPFWNNFSALNNYVARTQSFLQQGKPDNDVLLYFPIYERYSEPGRDLLLHFDGMKPDFKGTAFETGAQYMQEKGYAFDYVSDRQIMQLASLDKKIATGGTTYQTIVLPDCKCIKSETFKKLVDLATNGATIIIYKNLSKNVPGFGQLEQQTAALQSLIGQLHFNKTNVGNVEVATIGKGKFLMGDDLQQLMDAGSIRQEKMNEAGLQFNRRKNADGSTVYFLANRGKTKIDQWVAVSANATGAVIFNALTGQSGLAETRKNSEGKWEVYLQLEPDESCILQTASKNIIGNKYPYIKHRGAVTAIDGPWNLTFTTGGPSLPSGLALANLQAWTSIDSNNYQIFSGTGSYKTNFKRPSGNDKSYILDLGKVYESAEVLLNGKTIATLIGPSFSTIIYAKDLFANNVLEVKVSNSMANRIIDLDKRKVKWRKFNNTNFAARLRQNTGADGLFDASKWEPRTSGLVGPVTITAVLD